MLIVGLSNSCGINHIILASKISEYNKSLDPELCEALVYEIHEYNEICSPVLDIMDCG